MIANATIGDGMIAFAVFGAFAFIIWLAYKYR